MLYKKHPLKKPFRVYLHGTVLPVYNPSILKNDFLNHHYLKTGNPRQQEAYKQLQQLKIFENLKAYTPVLTGTIPIEIDIPESDLDIICYCKNHQQFEKDVAAFYAKMDAFTIKTTLWNHKKSIVAKFKTHSFTLEIFGQNTPVEQQHAYKHMLIEHKILQKMGPEFKAEIIKLKKEGLKTEPAFAKLLGLQGNPYTELLKVTI